jgi:hypothetical protein
MIKAALLHCYQALPARLSVPSIGEAPHQLPVTFMPASPLTHFNPQGQAQMVDVGAKAETHRSARAPATFRCARRPWT